MTKTLLHCFHQNSSKIVHARALHSKKVDETSSVYYIDPQHRNPIFRRCEMTEKIEPHGPYFEGQVPSECGCFFPDVTRVSDDAKAGTRTLYCIHHGYRDIPLDRYTRTSEPVAIPTDAERESERQRLRTGNREKKFSAIVQIAVKYSGGRLRIAHSEKDENDEYASGIQNFLKLDGKRLGQDIEAYASMSSPDVDGWPLTLTTFLAEVVHPLKNELPESYVKASEMLCLLGESVFAKEMIEHWRGLF